VNRDATGNLFFVWRQEDNSEKVKKTGLRDGLRRPGGKAPRDKGETGTHLYRARSGRGKRTRKGSTFSERIKNERANRRRRDGAAGDGPIKGQRGRDWK